MDYIDYRPYVTTCCGFKNGSEVSYGYLRKYGSHIDTKGSNMIFIWLYPPKSIHKLGISWDITPVDMVGKVPPHEGFKWKLIELNG